MHSHVVMRYVEWLSWRLECRGGISTFVGGSRRTFIVLIDRSSITWKFRTWFNSISRTRIVYSRVFALLRQNTKLFRVKNRIGSSVEPSSSMKLFVLSSSISAFVLDCRLNGSSCSRPRGGVGSEQPPSSDSDDYSAIHQHQGHAHSGHGQSLDSCAVPKVQVSGPSNADESASIINGWVNNVQYVWYLCLEICRARNREIIGPIVRMLSK